MSWMTNKTKPCLQYLRHAPRRKRTLLILFSFLLTFSLLVGHYLYSYVFVDFPELAIAQQYQPTPAIGTTIPKIVHFIYGLRPPEGDDGLGPSLLVIHYLAIKSAHDQLKPDTIMFHYHYLPTGPLFEQVRPWLTLNKVDLVPKVFNRPVTHFAHQADVVRLAVLQQYGGIYLDIDVITLKSMDHLLHHEFVMGQEGEGGSVGLCNGVILAKPNARFLQRWRETYRTFRKNQWNYHSVVLPGKLAKTGEFNNEITILDQNAFFWPLWNRPGLRTMLLEKSYDFSRNYATHVWESFSTVHLMKDLTLDVVRHVDNSLYCQLRYILDDDQDKIRPCSRLGHSTLENQLVGYWPLKKPNDKVLLEINPTSATDISGNEMNGIIRNGKFDDGDGGVYVSGKDSYLFLSMPNQMTMNKMTVQWQMKMAFPMKRGAVAMMIQSETWKVKVKTQWFGKLGVEFWQLTPDYSSWKLVHHINVITMDNIYHTFTLMLGGGGESNMVFYMDGVMVVSQQWTSLPQHVVHGIWFGSAEPDRYQDPWDTRNSLAAWYRDIRIWEQPLTMDTTKLVEQ